MVLTAKDGVMEVEAMDFATGNVNHTLESIFV